MKLSESTLNILKNFSTINPSILVKEGNVLSTISPQRSIFAKATVEETFPAQFAIYELSKFLGVLTLFKDPEIELGSKQMTIKSGKQSLNYTYADPSMLIVPPEKDITFPEPDIEFDVSQEELQKVVRATGVLQLPDIAVVGDSSTIRICATNSKNPTTDTFTVDVGSTDKNFNMVFKAENIIKLLSTNYNVKVSSKGLALFTSDSASYYVATEANSSFNK
ncbi:sliding clamp [uncultured Caudovirales phage]|uniref:Sliding clamp n=1 Tax=uncultured Caudovirales phage TaxID=2100421 RepID=A0A6J7WUP3_9CAUD|nr:sliding clamp [uncultured Caudovirales phage]